MSTLTTDSPYRQNFNGGILKLQENGILDKLKRKWWKEERKGTGCAVMLLCISKIYYLFISWNIALCFYNFQEEEAGSMALGIAHVGGVFVVLVAGCAVAIIFAFIEFFWENRKIASEEGVCANMKLRNL